MEEADELVVVYRFRREADGIEPRYMWGTLGAIAMLDRCRPIPETARRVVRDRLQHGFLIESGMLPPPSDVPDTRLSTWGTDEASLMADESA